MFSLKDLIALLDRWDVWKRVSASPDRLDAIERRVAELEEKLGGLWPPDTCKSCGARAARMSRSTPFQHDVEEEWTCAACGGVQHRRFKA